MSARIVLPELAARLSRGAFPGALARRLSFPAAAQQTTMSSDKLFDGMKGDVFGDRAILVDTGLVGSRRRSGHRMPRCAGRHLSSTRPGPGGVKAVTMIIDANPAPVAATFRWVRMPA